MITATGKYTWNPLQVLLPLAALFLLHGLMQWVFAFVIPGYVYPGRAHADVLSAVFAPSAFLALLFYTLPRSWNVSGLRPIFMALFLLNAFVLFVSASINPPVALSLFIMFNSGALVFVLRRVPYKETAGIGAYTYIIIALLAAITGGCLSLLVALDAVGENWWFWHSIADGIQFQGDPILFLLGLSAEVLGRHRSEALSTEKSRFPVWFQTFLALAFLLTFVLGARPSAEAPWYLDARNLAQVFRAVFFAWIVLIELDPFSKAKHTWRHAKSIQFTVWFVFLGLLLPAFWMQYRVAFEHMIFVGGYVWLIVLLVSELAPVKALSGLTSIWGGHKKQRNWFVVLMSLGLSTRVTSDIWTGSRPLHLAAASLCVIAALTIWGLRYKKFISDSEV